MKNKTKKKTKRREEGDGRKERIQKMRLGKGENRRKRGKWIKKSKIKGKFRKLRKEWMNGREGED